MQNTTDADVPSGLVAMSIMYPCLHGRSLSRQRASLWSQLQYLVQATPGDREACPAVECCHCLLHPPVSNVTPEPQLLYIKQSLLETDQAC